MPHGLRLMPLEGDFAVCRLPAHAPLPTPPGPGFWAVTRTAEEVSIVCLETHVPEDAVSEDGWRGLRVQGPLDFSLTGILAALAVPLARVGIPIFAVSTYATDYLFVRSYQFEDAVEALRTAGHVVG